jgi:hypothetical protein
VIGYSGTELFRGAEIELWRAATQAIAQLDDRDQGLIRCHELARAIAALPFPEVLSVRVQDGLYGAVDHSWLLVWHPRRHVYDLLDVYCVGRLPMVQLVSLDVGPMHSALYRAGPARTDIDLGRVSKLTTKLRAGWPFRDIRKDTLQDLEEQLQFEAEVNDPLFEDENG